MMLTLTRGERQYVHWPWWGLDAVIPEIQVGRDADWVAMTPAPGYTPEPGWEPPSDVTGDPTWFQALLASPEATGNPVGTFVLSTTATRVRGRAVAGDEVDVKPDGYSVWVRLV